MAKMKPIKLKSVDENLEVRKARSAIAEAHEAIQTETNRLDDLRRQQAEDRDAAAGADDLAAILDDVVETPLGRQIRDQRKKVSLIECLETRLRESLRSAEVSAAHDLGRSEPVTNELRRLSIETMTALFKLIECLETGREFSDQLTRAGATGPPAIWIGLGKQFQIRNPDGLLARKLISTIQQPNSAITADDIIACIPKTVATVVARRLSAVK